jgi:cell division septation protein DedD
LKGKNVKKSIFIYICTSLFFFSSASPWEGSGVVAPVGELPEKGFFIATNSYPQNSVVDITNLETDKTTRVIVASTLDSPGLLAIVSREAAELIGMKAGIISRIKIVQPFEPIAYLRFKESLSTGIPGYDSGNVITEESYRYDTYVPPVVVEYEKTEPVASGVTGPSYTLEPEWQNREIIDVPFNLPPATETPVEEIEEPEYIAEDEPVEEIIEEPEYIAEDEPVIEEEIIEEPEYITEEEPVIEEEIIEEPEYIAEDEPVEEIIDEPEIVEVMPSPELKEYELAAAEERPPEGTIYGIDPADIIPGITRPPQTSESATPVIPENLFSVPRLSQGGYYVQIAALSSPDLFEDTVNGIDRRYPIVIDDKNNLYRILLGPLNQGESAAVLQRFKSIGFNDAFVRLER